MPAWKIDGKHLAVDPDSWAISENDRGGYDIATVQVPADQIAGVEQEAELTAWTDGAEDMFAGIIAAPPRIINGIAYIKAEGAKRAAEKYIAPLLYVHYGPTLWTERGGDPHNRPVEEDSIDVDIRLGSLKFSVKPGTSVAQTDENGATFYAPGSEITTVAFTGAGNIDANNVLDILSGTGPTGESVDSTKTATGAVDEAITAGNDMVGLRFRRAGVTATVGNRQLRQIISALRARGYSTDDTMTVAEVFAHAGALMGYDVDLVGADTLNAMPLYHRDSNGAALFDYLAKLTAGWWRVRYGDKLETGRYADSKVHYAHLAKRATDISGLEPQTKYNRVAAWYTPVGSQDRRKVTGTAEVPELDSRGRELWYPTDLDITDPQPNATFAQVVADLKAEEVAQDRQAGRVATWRLRDASGRDTTDTAHAGDLLVIPDWDQGRSVTMQMTSVERAAHQPIAIGIGGEPATVDALLAQNSLVRQRR